MSDFNLLLWGPGAVESCQQRYSKTIASSFDEIILKMGMGWKHTYNNFIVGIWMPKFSGWDWWVNGWIRVFMHGKQWNLLSAKMISNTHIWESGAYSDKTKYLLNSLRLPFRKFGLTLLPSTCESEGTALSIVYRRLFRHI